MRATSALSIVAAIMTVAVSACHRAVTSSASAPQPTASPTPAGSAMARPTEVTDARVQEGDSIFTNGSCHRCHGDKGAGGEYGPSLTTGKWLQMAGGYDDIVRLVTTGVPVANIKDPSHKLNMRPRGGMVPLLTDDQVRSVAAYVYTISRGKQPP